MSPVQRPPCPEFLYVFQHYDPRPDHSRPPQHYPCKPPNIFVFGLAPFCLGEVLAIRTKPCQCYRMPFAGSYRINIPYRFTVMSCARMVGFMHPYGFWVMVDSNIHAYPCCHLYACAGTAATCEIINYQFAIYHFLYRACYSVAPAGGGSFPSLFYVVKYFHLSTRICLIFFFLF